MTSIPWIQRLSSARLLFLLLAALGFALYLFPFWAPVRPETFQARAVLLALSASVGLILMALIGEAQLGLTAHSIAMVGTLVGLNTGLRVIETVVPLPGGFSPVFLLIILVGHLFGVRLGFLMGALTMLVSGPLTAGGLGPWTPYQMLAAGWVGMGAAWVPGGRVSPFLLGAYGAIWGWLYGALTNLSFWPYAFNAPDLGWQPGLGLIETLVRYGRFYFVTSFAWDSMRALGNLVLLALLGKPVLTALERFRRRAHVEWEPV